MNASSSLWLQNHHVDAPLEVHSSILASQTHSLGPRGPNIHYHATLVLGSKLLQPPRKERDGNRLPWISMAQTKEQPQQTGGLTAYLHADTIVPDRFISSWVPAMRCKTQSFVSRGRAAAKRMLDTLSESPGGGISGRHPSRPIAFSCSPLLTHTFNLPLLSTLFRDLLLPGC